ncbi:MAG: TatD family hydrolase [Bacteroidales bacterium]|nr:TatD family hydrolase [Bacteroidales bacterium]MDD4770947.1 TatD family hydrolase [Bacteroidales bacterium]
MILPDVHTHRFREATGVLSIVNRSPSINEAVPDYPYSVGIHPWHVHRFDRSFQIEEAWMKAAVFIGEIGLDKRCTQDWALQQHWFEKQLTWAEAFHKPVILHVVASMQEVLQTKRDHPHIPMWVIHGFRGSLQQMQQYIQHGFYISFGVKLNEAALRACPMERLFLETDDDDAPIEELFERVAQIKQTSVEQLSEAMLKRISPFL